MTPCNASGVIICAVCLGGPSVALAQTPDDVFDLKHGARVVNCSPTLATFEPEGIIGGATAGEINAGVTIFRDGGRNYVEIKTPRAVRVGTVELFVRSDNYVAGGARSVAEFKLLADVDDDGQFEAVLVDEAQPLNDATANRYSFKPTAAASFRAEFTSGSIVGGELDGPRIIEIDAFEPSHSASWFWPIIGTALAGITALVLYRRRHSGAGAPAQRRRR